MRRYQLRFPNGVPGAGLIALRLLVATSLWPVASRLMAWVGDPASFWITSVLFIAIVVGAFTPFATTACLLVKCMAIPGTGHAWQLTGIAILGVIALGLLGPGAYSLDALRHGEHSIFARSRH
jgi:hypothetical protein